MRFIERGGSPSAAPDMYIWMMPKQKRLFLVEIEAKLTVHAFDEDSARKKVEKRSPAVGRSASM